MFPSTFGDMTRQLVLGRQSTALKEKLTVLSYEMTHGLAYDNARKLEGRLGIFAGLEQSIDRAETRQSGAQTVLQLLGMQQAAVSSLTAISEKALAAVAPAEETGIGSALDRGLAQLSESFSETIRVLNTRFSGRSLFSGTAGEQPAVADPVQILDALASDLVTPTDVATLSAFVDTWFDLGGDFDTTGYLGSSETPSPIQLGQGPSVRIDVTAKDPAIRRTLAAFAKSALFERVVPDASPDEKRALLKESREALMNTTYALIDLGARIGGEEEKAANAKMRAEVEKSSLSIARTELLVSDPYEAASKLEQTMTLLDTIHALTARLSRLSLANYLR